MNATASPTVVVIDDDAMVRKILQTMLERDGYEVAAASTAEEAIPVVTTTEPEVVFVDAMLADKDGLEVGRAIRSIQLPSQPYLILLTGDPQRFEGATATESGFDLVMGKPFQAEQLLRRLAEVTHRGEG